MIVRRGKIRAIRWMHLNFPAKLSQFLPSYLRYVWSSVVVMEDNAFPARREFFKEILYENIAITAIQHSKMHFIDTFGDFSHTVE